MYILVPWKPVVLVWGLLSGMIFVGFVASSVLQGKDPFAPGATIAQPPVKHEVKMKDFLSWLDRQGRSPAEVILKQKLEKILGKVNQARSDRKG